VTCSPNSRTRHSPTIERRRMKRPDMSWVYEQEQKEAEAELEEVRAELEEARPRAEEAARVFEEAYGSEIDEMFAYAKRRKHRWIALWTPPEDQEPLARPLRDQMFHFLYHFADEKMAMDAARERWGKLAASERRLKRKIQKAKREARKAKEVLDN
jgi:hypothetical protein